MSRLLRGRLRRAFASSRSLYPVGLLFGLGFDTATEIGLLALATGLSTSQVPLVGVLSLPVLFAAGMCLLDTADGVFMSHAYVRAGHDPDGRRRYDLAITGLSVGVALTIGSLELLALGATRLPSLAWAHGLNLGYAGLGVVGAFTAIFVALVARGWRRPTEAARAA